MPKFHELFKKYRLKSEFESLSQFGRVMAEHGRIIDDSTFTHWQNGTRTPRDRSLLLTIIKIFIEKGGISYVTEANLLLESANQGYLTEHEKSSIKISLPKNIPFQAPNSIMNFVGRESIIKKITHKTLEGKIFLLHGPPGVGKTALAIKLAHELRDHFADGILWYKVDSVNPMDILLSIAYTFQENISPIQNLDARASVVRSILNNKKILFIFDNVEPDTNIQVLLPNSLSTVILTSKQKSLSLDSAYESIEITPFKEKEVTDLFNEVISSEYTKTYNTEIFELAKGVGSLPLALQIYAKQLCMKKQPPSTLLKLIKANQTHLKEISYENKTLQISINNSFQSLEKRTKYIFLSLGIFKGKDFSLQAVAAINKQSKNETEKQLQKLVDASLVELSTNQRYRIHPLIKIFIRSNSNYKLYKFAAEYYVKFLKKNKQKNTTFYNLQNIYPEKENMLFILEMCYKLKDYHEVLIFWESLGELFFETGEWEKVTYFGERIYKAIKASALNNNPNYIKHVLDPLARIFFYKGDLKKAEYIIHQEKAIATALRDEYLIQLSNQRLGRIYQGLSRFDEAMLLLKNAIPVLKKYNDLIETSYTYTFIAAGYLYKRMYEEALESLKAAFSIDVKTKDIISLILSSSMIGAVYYLKNETTSAFIYLNKAILLEEKYKIRIGAKVFNNLILALIEKDRKKTTNAEKHFSKAKNENQYLNFDHNVESMYPVISLIKDRLESAGYYIFY